MGQGISNAFMNSNQRVESAGGFRGEYTRIISFSSCSFGRARQLSSSPHSTVAMTPPDSCSSTAPIRSCATAGVGARWTWPETACTTTYWSCCWHTGCPEGLLCPWTRPVRCCGTTGATCTPPGPQLQASQAGVHHSQEP